MKAMLFVAFLLSIIVIMSFSCKKESKKLSEDNCKDYFEGYIIGFDQCTGGADASIESRGFVIASISNSDTLVTYNLPSSLFTFPKELFSGYAGSFLFPDTARNKYKIKFTYRYAKDDEKIYHNCIATIFLADYTKYVRDRQIILNCVTKAQ